MSCPLRLPYQVDQNVSKDWQVAGSNALYLTDISIGATDPNNDDVEYDGRTVDASRVQKAWAGPPVNTELETSTYAIQGKKSENFAISCIYDDGITELAKTVPMNITTCNIVRDSRHLKWDQNLKVTCR